MSSTLIIGLTALLGLIPVAVYAGGRDRPANGLYILLLAVAVVGQLAWALALVRGGWQTGIGAALALSVVATVVVFAVVALANPDTRRLTVIAMPYLAAVGLLGLLLSGAAGRPLHSPDGGLWLIVHIAGSVLAYGLLTMAAIAGFSAMVQERALKNKRPTSLSRMLPSMADAEALQVTLLKACAVVLFAGILTGVGAQYEETGDFLLVDHKTLLTVIVFAAVIGLLIAHYRAGMRGKGAARLILAAYLALTLAYPGVKFVTDVLLG